MIKIESYKQDRVVKLLLRKLQYVKSSIYVWMGDEGSLRIYRQPQKGFVYIDVDDDGDGIVAYCTPDAEKRFDIIFKYPNVDFKLIVEKFLEPK